MSAGWLTCAVALPDGACPAGRTLALGGLPTQQDVLCRYPSGAARHLALSARAAASGVFALAAGPAPPGDFTPPPPPSVVVTFANACRGQVTAQGSGYTSAPTASFSGAVSAEATVGWSDPSQGGNGGVTGLVFTDPGAGPAWTGATTLSGGGGGSGAAITAYVNYTYTATLTAPASFDWLSGPLVKEGRTTVTPLDQNSAAHPSMQVLFDVRCYSDGSYWIDVAVENALDVAGNVPNTYRATVTINGVPRYAGPLNVVHYPGQRWVKSFWVPTAGDQQSAMLRYDFGTAIQSGCVPRMDTRLANQPFAVGTGASWDILPSRPNSWIGDMSFSNGFNDPGAHTWIYEPPAAWAQYLAFPDDTATRDYVQRIAEQWCAYPCHLKNSDGTTILDGRGTSQPNVPSSSHYWIDSRAWPFSIGPSANQKWSGPATGFASLDNAHTFNWAFPAYLTTGRRSMADELVYNGNQVYFSLAPDETGLPSYVGSVRGSLVKQGGYGLFNQGQVRSVGWSLRTLALAAAFCPDVLRTWRDWAVGVMNNTLAYMDMYEAGTIPSANSRPQGGAFPGWWGLGSEAFSGTWAAKIWEENYVAIALDLANRLGFSGGTSKLLDQARFQVALLISDNNSQAGPNYFPSGAACILDLSMGLASPDQFSPTTFYTTLSACGLEAVAQGYGAGPTQPFRSDARLMCLILLRLGTLTDQANARAALAVLEASDLSFLWGPYGQSPTFFAEQRAFAWSGKADGTSPYWQ